MSYNPTEWKNGDLITADKLNKLENGVAESSVDSGGSRMFMVNINIEYDEGQGNFLCTADATPSEIFEAQENGQEVIAKCSLSEIPPANSIATSILNGSNDPHIRFQFIGFALNQPSLFFIGVWYSFESEQWEFETNSYDLTPSSAA